MSLNNHPSSIEEKNLLKFFWRNAQKCCSPKWQISLLLFLCVKEGTKICHISFVHQLFSEKRQRRWKMLGERDRGIEERIIITSKVKRERGRERGREKINLFLSHFCKRNFLFLKRKIAFSLCLLHLLLCLTVTI